MNETGASLETGAGRRSTLNPNGQQHFRDQQLPQKRPRSPSSTMQSTANILPPNNDRINLKTTVRGNYSNSSSMEMYFAWFSAITFIGELAIGEHHGPIEFKRNMIRGTKATPIN